MVKKKKTKIRERKLKMKKLLVTILLASIAIILSCDTDANIASRNLSKAADQFEIQRRIVFYNGITDKYILMVEGLCSVEFFTEKFTVTCKTGPNEYKKHYLGRADNVFPFVEQLDPADVSTYRYRVVFKPTSIIPDIDVK
jgi:hypothetical protein